MMSHKSRYRFDLMRTQYTLHVTCTIAGVADGNAASIRYVLWCCHLFYRFQYFTRFHLCAFDAPNWWFHLMPIRYRAIHQIKDFVFIGKQQLHCIDVNRQTVYHHAQYTTIYCSTFWATNKAFDIAMCSVYCVRTFFCIVMSLINLSI